MTSDPERVLMNLPVVREGFAFQGVRMVKIDTRLLVLVTKEQRKELFARAKKDQTTVSALVRSAVDQFFGKHGDTDATEATE